MRRHWLYIQVNERKHLRRCIFDVSDIFAPTAVSSLFSDSKAVRRKLKHSLSSSHSTGGSVQCKRDSRRSSVSQSLFSQVLLPSRPTPSFLTGLVFSLSYFLILSDSLTSILLSSLAYLLATTPYPHNSIGHPSSSSHWQPSVIEDALIIYPYRTTSSFLCVKQHTCEAN